jgi:hypothetical protein
MDLFIIVLVEGETMAGRFPAALPIDSKDL